MNRKEIKDFIFLVTGKCYPFRFMRHNGNYNNALDFIMKSLLDDKEVLAAAISKVFSHTVEDCILINKEKWIKHSLCFKKCVILHELGHIHDPNKRKKAIYKSELFATTWAIKKAKQLKMYYLASLVTRNLNRWGYYKYNSNARPYLLAHRLAKKQGII